MILDLMPNSNYKSKIITLDRQGQLVRRVRSSSSSALPGAHPIASTDKRLAGH